MNNGCVECPRGHTSENGSRCVPCSENRYGNRCSENCECSTQQRCDRVYGCIDMITEFQRESTVTEDFWTWSKSHFTAGKTEDIAIKTEKPFIEDIGNVSTNGILQVEVSTVLYVGVSTLVTFGFIIFLVIYLFQRKHRNILPSDGNTSGTNQIDGNSNVELNEHLYHTIDDDILVDTNTDISFQQQNVHSQSSACVSASDTSGYLHPYYSENTLEQTNDLSADDARNTEPLCIPSDADSFSYGSTMGNLDGTSIYLNPYCSLYSSEIESRTHSEVKSDISLPENSTSKSSDKLRDAQSECNILKSIIEVTVKQNSEKYNEPDKNYVNTDVFNLGKK